jgi:hypothetical protein
MPNSSWHTEFYQSGLPAVHFSPIDTTASMRRATAAHSMFAAVAHLSGTGAASRNGKPVHARS